MAFNNGKEKEIFRRKHEKMRIEYKAAGMSDEDIDQIFEWDWQLYLEERRYREHTLSVEEFVDDDTECFDDVISLIEKLGGDMSEEAVYFSGELTSCLDYVDSVAVHKALKRLGKKQWTILYLYAICGLSQREIARALGISPPALCQQIETIRKKIKKYSDSLNF